MTSRDETENSDRIRFAVREHYAQAARAAGSSCGPSGTAVDLIGRSLYGDDEAEVLPEGAVVASLGCGNPTLLADLAPGETVLDLGSGGGIDVLLSSLWPACDESSLPCRPSRSSPGRVIVPPTFPGRRPC
jgi:hypothetical protein